jgi:hypothetical protein
LEFFRKFTDVNDTGGKFATGVNDSTSQSCPNKIITTFMIEDFFTFATSVIDTGGAP